MPKSHSTTSPPTHSKQHPSDEPRMSDIALRKKKNADAQAAFRARRANYIQTLEETVTSLESVVLQLQESCREARHESQELRQENGRLRHEFREREKFWRALWQARKPGQGPESDDPPPMPVFSSPHSSQMPSVQLQQYGGGSLPFRVGDDASACNGSYETSPADYHGHQPSLAYSGGESDITGDTTSNPLTHRGSKYSPFAYPILSMSREPQWPSPITQSSSSGGDSGGATHSSHSSGFSESPTLTATDMSFVARFPPPEDQKVPLSSLDTAPYAFPNSRSISPTTSTPGSTSSTPLTPFQFAFSDNGNDRPDHLDYRRHSHPHGAEVTLHGGTADVSLIGPASDAVRYRLGHRRDHSAPDRTVLPALPPMSESDTGSQQEQGSSDGDSTPYPPHSRSRLRRGMTHSRSRSPSPAPPILSGTLAVIKAQAFGALRRTRTRTKKSAESASKVVLNVLESRGIGISGSPSATPSLKRQRLDDDLDLS